MATGWEIRRDPGAALITASAEEKEKEEEEEGWGQEVWGRMIRMLMLTVAPTAKIAPPRSTKIPVVVVVAGALVVVVVVVDRLFCSFVSQYLNVVPVQVKARVATLSVCGRFGFAHRKFCGRRAPPP